jgi:hypothetical protein
MQLRVAAGTTSGILLAAAAYELAPGAGSVEPDPGDGGAGADVVFGVALAVAGCWMRARPRSESTGTTLVVLRLIGTTALAADGH